MKPLLHVALVLASALAVAEDPAGLVAQLQKEYGGKVVSLRQYCRDAVVRFDAAGHVNCQQPPDSWSLDSALEVEQVAMLPGAVSFEGHRLGIVYDHKEEKPVYVRVNRRGTAIGALEGPASRETLLAAMRRMFLTADEMDADMRKNWRYYLEHPPGGKFDADKPPKVLSTDIQKFDASIEAPRAKETSDPAYTEQARKAGLQGIVRLWAVIDETGRVADLRIVRPLGLGLDEKAIEAVRRWKFKPATKDGKPVKVQINIDVSFRLE